MNQTINEVLNKLFYTALLGLATFVASSISSLNERVAIVIERVVTHEKRLDGLDNRILNLFQRK